MPGQEFENCHSATESPIPAAQFSSSQPGAEKFPVNFLLFTGRHFFAPASVAPPPGGAAAKMCSPDERLRHPGNVAPGLRKRNPGYGWGGLKPAPTCPHPGCRFMLHPGYRRTATWGGVAGTRTAALYECMTSTTLDILRRIETWPRRIRRSSRRWRATSKRVARGYTGRRRMSCARSTKRSVAARLATRRSKRRSNVSAGNEGRVLNVTRGRGNASPLRTRRISGYEGCAL